MVKSEATIKLWIIKEILKSLDFLKTKTYEYEVT